MKSNAILRIFVGLVCPNCKKGKQKNTGFCGHCYRRLPQQKRDGLWRRFGSGFEEAFIDAGAFLSDLDTRTKTGSLFK